MAKSRRCGGSLSWSDSTTGWLTKMCGLILSCLLVDNFCQPSGSEFVIVLGRHMSPISNTLRFRLTRTARKTAENMGNSALLSLSARVARRASRVPVGVFQGGSLSFSPLRCASG
jgi:hypothetical protein